MAVLAVAGCGGSTAVPAPSGPAPDPDRTRDLVPLTTKQAVRAADRIAVVVVARLARRRGRAGHAVHAHALRGAGVLKGGLPHASSSR